METATGFGRWAFAGTAPESRLAPLPSRDVVVVADNDSIDAARESRLAPLPSRDVAAAADDGSIDDIHTAAPAVENAMVRYGAPSGVGCTGGLPMADGGDSGAEDAVASER